jgi:hypothetical protein
MHAALDTACPGSPLVIGAVASRLNLLSARRRNIVPITWGLTATTFAAVAAVGLAGPACACEPFGGTYSLDNGGEPGALTTWIVNSTCGPTGCLAHVASSRGWSGDAQLVGGRWIMAVDRSDGTVCVDGELSGAIQTWSWDPETLNGEVSGLPNGQGANCQAPADSFTLTKVG